MTIMQIDVMCPSDLLSVFKIKKARNEASLSAFPTFYYILPRPNRTRTKLRRLISSWDFSALSRNSRGFLVPSPEAAAADDGGSAAAGLFRLVAHPSS